MVSTAKRLTKSAKLFSKILRYGTVLPLKDAVLVRQIGQISEEGNLKNGV